MLQTEYDSYKNQYDEATFQNEMLMRQNRNLQDKVKRLNEIAVRFKQKTEQVEGALEYANLRQQKETGLLRDATNAKKKEIYGILCSDAQTTTALQGISNNFGDCDALLEPKISKLVQCDGIETTH